MTNILKAIGILIVLVMIASCDNPKVSKPTHYLSVQGQVVNFPEDNKYIVLNFWAAWCAPCQEEIQSLNTLHRRHDVTVVGVNVDNLTGQNLLDVIQKYQIKYPVLSEDPHKRFKLTAYPGIPATYILTPDGRWKEPLFGKQTEKSILEHMSS